MAGHELPPFIDAERIETLVSRLAREIEKDHPDDEPLVVVAAMKGALVFCADLIRKLHVPIELELLQPRSYKGAERGQLIVEGRLDGLRIAGRNVLLVDCVLDSGHTLRALRSEIAQHSPATVRTCVLLRKSVEREAPVEPEYVGMNVEDAFIVGYGLDHANRWRHLPYIAVLPLETRTETTT